MNQEQVKQILDPSVPPQGGACNALEKQTESHGGTFGTCWPEVVDQKINALQPQIESPESNTLESGSLSKSSLGTLEQLEKAAILETLNQNQWQAAKAAKEVGIGQTTLYCKTDKYKIVPPNKRHGSDYYSPSSTGFTFGWVEKP